jgi:parvulin-like peptidyl-prolyl isomerase
VPSRKRRREKIPTPAWDHGGGGIAGQVRSRSPRFWGTAAVITLVVVALGIVAYGFAADYRADQRRPGSTALRIDDTSYTVRYYTERLRMYVNQFGGPTSDFAQPSSAFPAVSRQLIEEAAILRFAEEEGVTATEEDVNEEIATRLGITTDDEEFDDRVLEEAARTNLSLEEYLTFVEATVLRGKLLEKFTNDVPETAESVHYRQIQVANQEEADAVRLRIEEGEDFEELAAELSLDEGTKDDGGDMGWAPRGVLDRALEQTLFALDAGAVTTYPTGTGAFVYQVLEKDPDRPIDETYKPSLAQRQFSEWMDEKLLELQDLIDDRMDILTGDADKIRWAIARVYTT